MLSGLLFILLILGATASLTTVATAQGTPPPQTTDIKYDLKVGGVRPARMPILEIQVPGLKPFSATVASSTDSEGNVYLYLPWMAQYLATIYKFAIIVASIVAVVMLIQQGIVIIMSAGGEAKGGAYKRIGQITIGLFIAWGSYVIFYTINPELVNLRALKVIVVPGQELREAKSFDDTPDPTPNPKCTDPNMRISDPKTINLSLAAAQYATIKGKLTPDLIDTYKKAVGSVPNSNVPWQFLATIHYKEAGMNKNSSILNGGSFCNTANDGDLLSWCSECATPNLLNDLICGVKKIKKKADGGLLTMKNSQDYDENTERIKNTFCKYNGCFTCADVHPYVTALIDEAHSKLRKQVHDCVPMTCKMDTVSDFTVNPPVKNHGCSIKIFKSSDHPNIGLTNYCLLNQGPSRCRTDQGEKVTYNYNDKERTDSNPCGSWVPQARVGALGIYWYIMQNFQ